MWKVKPYRGRKEPAIPFSLYVEPGDRYMSARSDFDEGMNVPYLSLSLVYGDRFDDSHRKPFDWFKLEMMMNFSSDQSTFSNVDVRGRIASLQKHSKNNLWSLDFGFYQLLKYLETYPIKKQKPSAFPIISEAVSFGAGLFTEYDNKKVGMSNDFILSLVPLGGQRSDYYEMRKYNFSHGFSVRNDYVFTLKNGFSIGNNLYFVRFFTLDKYTPSELKYRLDTGELLNTPGDCGQSSILVDKMFVQIPLFSRLNLNLEHVIHYRHSKYKYYPSVSKRFYEYKAGLIYKI
jgi:hypothetical protein